MKNLRLLPIVLVGATALLLLKGVGLVTRGGYTLIGTGQAQAQLAENQGPGSEGLANGGQQNQGGAAGGAGMEEQKAEELTPIEEAAARRAADSLFSSINTPVPGNGQADAVPVLENDRGEISEFGNGDGVSPTEQAILQRLRERRAELDAREQAVRLQEDLVLAAEARLNEKIASLQAVEARIQALVDEQKALDDEQFNALVSMYANMKPADAANVFNSLDMEILLRLAIKMSPRKMSPILADMNVERAQQLTVRMATARIGELESQIPAQQAAPADMASLPQIVGQ